MIFENKVVLILGGTGSIGAAVADAFEKEGARVCRHGLEPGEYRADLSSHGEAQKLIQKVVSKYGKIDILVNSISKQFALGSFEKKTWEDFSGHFEVQLRSGVEVSQLVIPLMQKEKSGRIINIITAYTAGKIPSGLTDYISAKYALLGFTKALAKELGKFNITVNAVSPGFIENGFTSGTPPKALDFIIHDTPMGRLTNQKDAASAVLFLASDGASQITGENIIVDGGYGL